MRRRIGVAVVWLVLSGGPLLAQSSTAPLRPQISDEPASGVMIQLSAERSETEAAQSWIRIVAKSDDILTDLAPRITAIKHGRRGKFFRLRAGPLPRDAASAICKQLQARKLACDVVP